MASAAAMALAYADHGTTDVLAEHIRAGYLAYSQARIEAAVSTYLICLSAVGVLGIVCWLATIRAVNRGKRRARVAATALFVLGTAVAVTDLVVKDTSGDTALPALLGWAGMLPSLAGFVAVTLLWRRQ